MNSASQLTDYCTKNGLRLERKYTFLVGERSYWCTVTVGRWQETAQNTTKKRAYEDACEKVLQAVKNKLLYDALRNPKAEVYVLGDDQQLDDDVVSRLERMDNLFICRE